MDIRDQIMSAFQVEHREQVAGIRAILASLNLDAALTGDVRLDDAFRMAHTLKGGARVCELREIEVIGHHMESLFARIREGTLRLSNEVRCSLEHSLDAIEDWMAARTSEKSPPAPTAALAELEQILAIEPKNQSPEGLTQTPTARDLPAEAAAPATGPETLRIESGQLDGVLRASDSFVLVNAECDRVSAELRRLKASVDELQRSSAALFQIHANAMRGMAADPRIASIAEHVERQLQDVRRMVRQQRSLSEAQRSATSALQDASARLHESVQAARMAPAGEVLQGLGSAVRILARDEGKEVEFVAEGLDLRVDRMVLQQLKDALLHVLRNAVVHGIETPAERARRAKKSPGRIQLRLARRGHRLQIEVDDDGRGLDWPRITALAQRRGLWSQGAAADPESRRRLAQMLFLPAFSTCEQVGELAGRGMGLSVVHESVKRLRGQARILPGATCGSRLEILVPFTLSAERMLLVSVQEQIFALPLASVERVIQLNRDHIQKTNGTQAAIVGDRPISLESLGPVLGAGTESLEGATPLRAVLVRTGAARSGYVVDAVIGERDLLIRPLDEPAAGVSPFNGAALLENNVIVLAIDPGQLVQSATRSSEVPALPKTVTKKSRSILVVDDSFTTRTLEKSILETHGFDVRVAVNGLEALMRLRSEPVDLVIADIEMPKMDGLALLHEIRTDATLQRVPVVLVTSLDKPTDRQRGMDLGADAYIVKRRFDHEELLAAIEKFL